MMMIFFMEQDKGERTRKVKQALGGSKQRRGGVERKKIFSTSSSSLDLIRHCRVLVSFFLLFLFSLC